MASTPAASGGRIMATANANAAPGATRPVDQHVEFVVKVGVRHFFPVLIWPGSVQYGGLCASSFFFFGRLCLSLSSIFALFPCRSHVSSIAVQGARGLVEGVVSVAIGVCPVRLPRFFVRESYLHPGHPRYKKSIGNVNSLKLALDEKSPSQKSRSMLCNQFESTHSGDGDPLARVP